MYGRMRNKQFEAYNKYMETKNDIEFRNKKRSKSQTLSQEERQTTGIT